MCLWRYRAGGVPGSGSGVKKPCSRRRTAPFPRSATAGFLLLAGIAGAPPAPAQEALEEITVTARKVSESLQDAPLSVVVLTGEAMAESGISRVEELVAYVPNFAMSETGIGTNLYVRGIGSGINQGFEQSVGLYIDGIYYGRAQLTRAPFMDMAQAEALRGPQAILLGNNSIAGALNFTTARPSDYFQSSVSGLYEPDHNEQEINGMVSGPIGEWLGGTWGARFAGRYRTMDGYIENTNLSNRDEPDREETSARLTIAYTGDTVDGTLKLETNSFDVKGRQIEIIRADPAVGRGTSQTGFSNNTGSSGYWRAGNNYLEFLDVFFDGPPSTRTPLTRTRTTPSTTPTCATAPSTTTVVPMATRATTTSRRLSAPSTWRSGSTR